MAQLTDGKQTVSSNVCSCVADTLFSTSIHSMHRLCSLIESINQNSIANRFAGTRLRAQCNWKNSKIWPSLEIAVWNSRAVFTVAAVVVAVTNHDERFKNHNLFPNCATVYAPIHNELFIENWISMWINDNITIQNGPIAHQSAMRILKFESKRGCAFVLWIQSECLRGHFSCQCSDRLHLPDSLIMHAWNCAPFHGWSQNTMRFCCSFSLDLFQQICWVLIGHKNT